MLDLGCGTGGLLTKLRQRGHRRLVGIELDERAICTCVCRGLDVVQGDLNLGLPAFDEGQFDFVVLSQTLQAVMDVRRVLHEMLRVGREAVISFPNFGYWRHRQSILNGRMPVSESLPHQWFNTPNVRFFTIADFEALCELNGIVIHERLAFDEGKVVLEEPNFLASVAVYRLGRSG